MPLSSFKKMFIASVISGLNSLFYSLLAFVIPLFFTVKALLRQYTVGIMPTSFASASVNVTKDDGQDDSAFIEAINPNTKPVSSSFTVSSTSAAELSPSNAHAWLHYWAILAVIHCLTGIYELVVLPFVGNSFLYHCAKYAGIYWLAKDEAKASRALWTAVIAPFAAKYEKEADKLVRLANQNGRVFIAKSVASLRSQLSTRSVKVPVN